jgi:hypothetical protein
MEHWLSYSLSDFLMFSPDTYFRLIELHNAAVWPAHVLAVLAAAAMIVLLWWWRPSWHGRAALVILAAAWLFVGWAFHLERYAAIFAAAPWFAGLFFLEAALLAWTALRRDPPFFPRPGDPASRLAATLLVFALVVMPLAAPLGGRPLTGAEVFAIAPDPTAAATIAVLSTARRGRVVLLAVPLFWCAASGLTLAAMGSPQALLLPVVGLLGVVAGLLRPRHKLG